MQIDKTTLRDLSIMEGENPVFSKIDKCSTQVGTDELKRLVTNPPRTLDELIAQQEAVVFWSEHSDRWPKKVSNGTLVMIQNFYESVDDAPARPNALGLLVSVLLQRTFNKDVYSFVRFSIAHLIDFLKGCKELMALNDLQAPARIKRELKALAEALEIPIIETLAETPADSSQKTLLNLSYRARRETKNIVKKMITHFARLDALRSLALATTENKWAFPEILPAESMTFQATGLVHPLLKSPTPYDIHFSESSRFMFLTGANMSGKSTLLRALGIAALLAHIGMGVPATHMKISFMHGVITNMQVEDNIFLGESYFLAEVKRMKLTAEKLVNSQYHLVLMDELFKGTNVHDAYECTKAVIDGLLGQEQNIMVLSTHLNELSTELQNRSGIFFQHCTTEISKDGSYRFPYELKEGVSTDRIGYFILKKQGILDLLQKGKD